MTKPLKCSTRASAKIVETVRGAPTTNQLPVYRACKIAANDATGCDREERDLRSSLSALR